MDTKQILEYIAGTIMLVGTLLIFYERIKNQKGIGVRIIQLIVVILLIPSVFILAMEGILNTETVAALFGAMIGYILSNLSDYKKQGDKE